MFTIIGGDGKEYGPVTADQIRAWITAGRANLDTKAKPAGTEDWRRLGDFAEFGGTATSSPPALPRSARVEGPVDAKAFADDLIARAAPLDVFGCIGRSFELWKSNFLRLVGVTLLILIIQAFSGMIPFVGALSSLLLNGVFYGGLYYYYLGLMRGEPRTVGDGFAGFSKALGPLVLATLLTTLLTLVVIIPFAIPFVIAFVKGAAAAQNSGIAPTMPGATAWIALCCGIVVMVYLSISWAFTFPLVIDRGLGSWTAMNVSLRVVSKQWFRVFAVAFLGGLLSMLGLVALFVGVFLTIPIVFGAILYAYEDLCNPPENPAVSAAVSSAAPVT
jgi:hypothetical protein